MKPTARPILFSAPMVRALVQGRKTQTRRRIKEPVHLQNGVAHVAVGVHGSRPWKCPYGVPGDLLWVRESFAHAPPHGVRYVATDAIHDLRKKKPGIHMLRWASRLTLEITDVRVEYLQAISDADAKAEGVAEVHQQWLQNDRMTNAWCRRSREIQRQRGVSRDCADDVGAYAVLWDQINGAGSWDTNPWVVAISFTVHETNVDAYLAQRREWNEYPASPTVIPAQAGTHGKPAASEPEAASR